MTEDVSDLLFKHVCELEDATAQQPFEAEIDQYLMLSGFVDNDAIKLIFTVHLDEIFHCHNTLYRLALKECFYTHTDNILLKAGVVDDHLVFYVEFAKFLADRGTVAEVYQKVTARLNQLIQAAFESN